MEPKKYLTHVNALRGLAILLVFLYHLQEQWCPQGFLGVDAFFVISGFFLIPPLLHRTYKGGSFKWWPYYKNKATRILPPLVVMTLAVLLAAIPLMIAYDLFMAASTARTVITRLSNVYLGLAATDYFAPGVKENLFLHTWYIAVLIQVLIAAPLLCRPLSQLRPVWQYFILALITVASLLIYFQHWLPREWQDALPNLIKNGGRLGSVYYMTAGRLWEIIAGGLIVLLPTTNRQCLRTALFSLGLLLLIIPCFIPHNCAEFALAAALGTLLIIRYGENTSLTRLFESKALLWLGTVSFSLYLIHWPTMALARYALMRDLTLLDCAWVTLLSLLLTWALYHGIEKRRPRLLTLALLWALTMALALFIRKTDGLKNWLQVTNSSIQDESSTEYHGWDFASESSWTGQYSRLLNPVGGLYGDEVLAKTSSHYGRAPIVQIGDKAKMPNFALMGDSYASALFPGFDIIGKDEGWSGLYLNLYMTPFWNRLNVENPIESNRFTKEKWIELEKWLKQNPHIQYIVVYQRWHWRFLPSVTWEGDAIPSESTWEAGKNSLLKFCTKIRQMGKDVIFIMPTPEANIRSDTKISHAIQRSELWYRRSKKSYHFESSKKQYDHTNGRVRQIMESLERNGYCHLIDPAPIIFKDGFFHPFDGQELIVTDRGHLSIHGAIKIIDGLKKDLSIFLKSAQN